jgi:hypothetical protein
MPKVPAGRVPEASSFALSQRRGEDITPNRREQGGQRGWFTHNA